MKKDTFVFVLPETAPVEEITKCFASATVNFPDLTRGLNQRAPDLWENLWGKNPHTLDVVGKIKTEGNCLLVQGEGATLVSVVLYSLGFRPKTTEIVQQKSF